MTKFFKYFILIVFSAASVLAAMADGNDVEKPKQPVRLTKKLLTDNGAPRTLDVPFLTCYYNNEYIEFALPDDVNYAEVTLGTDETTSIWSGIITPDFPGCDIPLLVGEYVITCTLDNGSAYQGVLAF